MIAFQAPVEFTKLYVWKAEPGRISLTKVDVPDLEPEQMIMPTDKQISPRKLIMWSMQVSSKTSFSLSLC